VVLVKFSTQENLLLYALALADRLYRSAEKIQRGGCDRLRWREFRR
jgi:hypothetical protein